jgi:hypothetical protein
MFMRRKDRRGGGDSPHEVFLRLRGQLLEVDPAELGLSPSPRLPRIWAMLMEMGLDTGTASLVAVADGTTSLYLSTGVASSAGASTKRYVACRKHSSTPRRRTSIGSSRSPRHRYRRPAPFGSMRSHSIRYGAPRLRKANSSTAEANWRRCSTPVTKSLHSSGSSTSGGSDRDTGA